MAAIILAGGLSRRMRGLDKAFLRIGRQPIIKRQIRILRKHFKRIIVVTNSPQKYNNLRKVEVVNDIMPYHGPLGGILTGLRVSGDRYNFVLACDMPFMNEKLIEYMLHSRRDYDALMPKIDGRPDPLFGIYSKSCLSVIEGLLRKKKLRVSGLFKKVKARFIPEHRLRQFDKGLLSLVNINTKEDLLKLK